MAKNQATEKPALSAGSLDGMSNFVGEVATYFMDFLETNFHKRRLPKRSISYKNASNYTVGINLRKYETFAQVIRKLANKGFPINEDPRIRRGKYTTSVPSTVIEQINKQVKQVTAEELHRTASAIAESISKNAEAYQDEIDIAETVCLDEVTAEIREKLVDPFVEKIEKPLGRVSAIGLDSAFAVAEGLVEIFVEPLRDIVRESLASLSTGGAVAVERQVASVLDLKSVQESLRTFFDELSINDLFFDVQELVNNKQLLEGQELYLYFCDIRFEKSKYPIFYLPLTVKASGETLELDIDTNIYLNKKALEYIIQEFNRQTERNGRIASISERILYTDGDSEHVRDNVQEILNDLHDYFQLQDQIDLETHTAQISKSSYVTITNSGHLCVFDKSDEALVNDYECIDWPRHKYRIQDMDVILTKMLDNSPPRFILDVIREDNGPRELRELSERELRILRYACRVAVDIEEI